ncbi:hypothetical protein ILYODFUR_011228, partial [Ilyodon furcidens]
MVTAAQWEDRRNDIFCPRLANPQDTSELETLMTTNNAQMVKLWGHTGPSDAARAPCGIGLHANYTNTHKQKDTGLNTWNGAIMQGSKDTIQITTVRTHTNTHTHTHTHTHTIPSQMSPVPVGVIMVVTRRSGLGRPFKAKHRSVSVCLCECVWSLLFGVLGNMSSEALWQMSTIHLAKADTQKRSQQACLKRRSKASKERWVTLLKIYRSRSEKESKSAQREASWL